jgi:hypothetical protein
MAKRKTSMPIQHYVIKLVGGWQEVFLGTPVSSINKTVQNDLTEILVKLAFDTYSCTT